MEREIASSQARIDGKDDWLLLALSGRPGDGKPTMQLTWGDSRSIWPNRQGDLNIACQAQVGLECRLLNPGTRWILCLRAGSISFAQG